MRKQIFITAIAVFLTVASFAELNYRAAIKNASEADSDSEIQAVMYRFGFKTATGTPADQFSFIDKLNAIQL